MNQKFDHPLLVVNPLLLMAAAIVVTLLLGWLVPLPFFGDGPLRLVGAVMFIAAPILGFPALRGMLTARTSPDPRQPTTALVEGGTYKLTRNPMYLSMVIAYAGLFIFLQNLWFLPFVPVLVWLLTKWVIVPEERYLEQKFGSEYQNFVSRVPRWI